MPYGELPNDPGNDNRVFFCSDGQERRYYVNIVVIACETQFNNFLSENLEFAPTAPPIPGEFGGRVQTFVCTNDGSPWYYGYTPVANYQRFIDYLRRVDRYDGFTPAGRAFFESERLAGETIYDYYQRAAFFDYDVIRFIAADGSYESMVAKGSRYHLQFPELLLVLPPP